MTDRPKIFHGLCDDGPWARKPMAHATPVFPVLVDRDTKWALPGAQSAPAGTRTRAGRYTFNEEFSSWCWTWDGE